MTWFAQAPANIALIKYMGKNNTEKNIPDNASLSFSLDNLLTTVTLETQQGKKNIWEPLITPGGNDFNLSVAGQERFLNHLDFIKSQYDYSGSFLVRSNNNFPHGAGLASSASSFAALTKCAALAMSELCEQPLAPVDKQAQWSREGSGSSCRSFYSPWALWYKTTVEGVNLPYENLIHQVIVVSHDEKKVSSSEAHKRVLSSPSYATRPQRAEENLKLLLTAFNAQDWTSAYQICWREFHDMHQLFTSCSQPFTYISAESQAALDLLQRSWEKNGDGPIITMDAGPNIHLLYRRDQQDKALAFKQDHLGGNYDVI